jgi:hypothetical protein
VRAIDTDFDWTLVLVKQPRRPAVNRPRWDPAIMLTVIVSFRETLIAAKRLFSCSEGISSF